MTRDKLNNLIGEAYSKWDAPYRPLIQLLGEGIRQLTRIADKLNERWDFNKEADELATEVNAQLATPAPDALVEAVRKVIDNAKPHKHEMAYFVVWKDYIAILEEALAAYEKEKSHGK